MQNIPGACDRIGRIAALKCYTPTDDPHLRLKCCTEACMKCVLALVTLSCLTAYGQGRQGESLIQQLRAAEPATAAALEKDALARDEAQAAIPVVARRTNGLLLAAV